MTQNPVYDPADTLAWMIRQAAAEARNPVAVDAAGRTRRKSKAACERDMDRLRTLAEVVWNAEGRRESLEDTLARALATA